MKVHRLKATILYLVVVTLLVNIVQARGDKHASENLGLGSRWMSLQLSRAKSHRKAVRRTTFRDFAECVSWVKKSVYIIVRGRQLMVEGQVATRWTTLGTGFIASPYRFLTAGHVIDDQGSEDELKHHKPGDIYYLLRTDGELFHWRSFTPRLDQELFLYSDVDLAIINLDEKFYRTGESIGLTKDDYLRIDITFFPIGSYVGVIGYPLSKLLFEGFDFARPRVSDIFLRADAGVINTRYKTKEGMSAYEFTMMFNPGNSGGPIFDIKTGRVISLVRGYRSTPIRIEEQIISDDGARKLKAYTEKAYIDVTHSTYSVGLATQTPRLIEILKKHNIVR